jgi:hypothetical protein
VSFERDKIQPLEEELHIILSPIEE